MLSIIGISCFFIGNFEFFNPIIFLLLSLSTTIVGSLLLSGIFLVPFFLYFFFWGSPLIIPLFLLLCPIILFLFVCFLSVRIFFLIFFFSTLSNLLYIISSILLDNWFFPLTQKTINTITKAANIINKVKKPELDFNSSGLENVFKH